MLALLKGYKEHLGGKQSSVVCLNLTLIDPQLLTHVSNLVCFSKLAGGEI